MPNPQQLPALLVCFKQRFKYINTCSMWWSVLIDDFILYVFIGVCHKIMSFYAYQLVYLNDVFWFLGTSY